MKQLTNLERFMSALKLEEPDVVPHWDGVHANVVNAILPDDYNDSLTGRYGAFVEYMDLDALGNYDKGHSWSYELVDEAKRVQRDQWGGLVQYTAEALPMPIAPAIRSAKDLEGYVPPDPNEEWRYDFLKKVVERFKGHRAIYAHATDVFNIAKESLLGEMTYFESIIDNPDLVEKVNEIVLRYNLQYIKNCIEVGIDCFYITGDYAMTKGPFVSPAHTARFIISDLKKQVDLCHSMDIPVIKHTDGNLWSIFDLILDTGIDAIHPIDPIAGMDLGEVKEKYGDRVCICGNVNCGSTLSWGSVEEVRQEVKECIRQAGHGGGYICTSSNSIHSGVKPENYIAMVKAIREFGKYPLQSD